MVDASSTTTTTGSLTEARAPSRPRRARARGRGTRDWPALGPTLNTSRNWPPHSSSAMRCATSTISARPRDLRGGDVGDVGLVRARHDQDVRRRLGGDVAERDDRLRLHHGGRGELPRDDPAEQAVVVAHGPSLSWGQPRAPTAARPRPREAPTRRRWRRVRRRTRGARRGRVGWRLPPAATSVSSSASAIPPSGPTISHSGSGGSPGRTGSASGRVAVSWSTSTVPPRRVASSTSRRSVLRRREGVHRRHERPARLLRGGDRAVPPGGPGLVRLRPHATARSTARPPTGHPRRAELGGGLDRLLVASALRERLDERHLGVLVDRRRVDPHLEPLGRGLHDDARRATPRAVDDVDALAQATPLDRGMARLRTLDHKDVPDRGGARGRVK